MIKNLFVSGCKPMELGIFKEKDHRIDFVKKAIERRLIAFIEEGLEWVIISGQMGVELWTAEVVLELKEEYDVRIAMIPPFENQAGRWPESLQVKYEELSFTVDYYEPLYQGEYRGPFQFRNRDAWLIQKTDACLLLMDEESPGSVGYFYNTAKDKANYSVYFITPFDIDDVVRDMEMQDPKYWDN